LVPTENPQAVLFSRQIVPDASGAIRVLVVLGEIAERSNRSCFVISAVFCSVNALSLSVTLFVLSSVLLLSVCVALVPTNVSEAFGSVKVLPLPPLKVTELPIVRFEFVAMFKVLPPLLVTVRPLSVPTVAAPVTFKVPEISSVLAGLAVPMPTLPLLAITNLVAPDLLAVKISPEPD